MVLAFFKAQLESSLRVRHRRKRVLHNAKLIELAICTTSQQLHVQKNNHKERSVHKAVRLDFQYFDRLQTPVQGNTQEQILQL